MQDLKELLLKKIQRQTLLHEKGRQLEDLDLDLSYSKSSRWFGSSYLRIKRFLLILISIGLIFFSFILMTVPEILMEDKEFRDSMIQSSREYYQDMFGQSLGEAFIEFTLEDSRRRPEDFFDELSKSLDKAYVEETIAEFRYMGVFILPMALVLLYISRLTKKMRIRNTMISHNQAITQELITMFHEAIDEEEEELLWMQEIIQGGPKPGSSQPPPLPG
ncbi:MAG: hypothetical protein HEP71_32675 [Roseivirga sp.]|nr:hypothetical protein [Roseivirga sp.]